MNSTIAKKLSTRLEKGGSPDVAHARLSPVHIGEYRAIKASHKKAGVLVLIYPKNNEAHVAFMKRTSNYPDDKHAGQISFPGGKKEDSDESLLACAERETMEEIGISSHSYTVLGELNPLYVYVSNFLVYPFLAVAQNDLQFDPEEDEVERIIEYPLKHFLYFKNVKKKDLHIRDHILKDVPYFDLNGEVLWGATSMIMSELVSIFEELDIRENQLKYS